jgi:putative ABC transport system substrate-binding protein
MDRRRFLLTALAGTLVGPVAARAQVAKLPTIGFLGPLTQAAQSSWTAAFVQRMHEHGWIEGRTVTIEYRWADGRSERLAEIVAEFVRMKVTIIVTAGTAAVIAAKQATAITPIVFATAGDPVGTGLVTSLARPGGNVTGLSNQSADLPAKRFDLLREVIPNLRRVAIMANVGNPIGVREMGEARAAARTLALEEAILELRLAEDIRPAIESVKSRADALYVVTDPLVNTHRIQVNTLALSARLPTIHGERGYVEAGGLVSYGPNFPDLFRRAGDYANKILRGSKPADLPVEQPTTFDLAINLKTARALGLVIPPSLLLRADQVIE